MPSSYTTSLRLTLPATGELAGQWGQTVNTGITELLDAAVAGTASISTWGGPGVAYTLSNNSGTADEARRMFIVATGTPGEAKNVICPAVSKFYVFRNDTTGGFALTLKTSGGTGISVPAGQYKLLYCDGTNVVETFNSAGALTLSGALTVNGTTTLASNPTLSAGTANGVTYLNGSKVLTSGSALTFDGTNLGLQVTPNAWSTTTSVLENPSGSIYTFSGTNQIGLNSNAYFNGTNWIYRNASSVGASDFFQQNGFFVWRNAVPGTAGNIISYSEQMRLTSTGLGIGTSSPAAKFETFDSTVSGAFVANTPSTWRVAQVRNNGTVNANNAAGIAFVGRTDVQPAGIVGVQSTTGGGVAALAFLTVSSNATAESMRLDSSGNLGIGTTSPSARFVISDSNAAGFEFNPNASGLGQLEMYNRSTAAYFELAINSKDIRFNTGTSPVERARITSGGDLLVGTTATTSGARLDVKGVDSTGGNYCVFFENSSSALLLAVQNDGRWRSGTAAASPYNFVVGATNRDLFVDNAGEIGYVASVRASKINITPVADTEWLLQLNPVTFNFRKKDAEGNYTDKADGPIKHGLIAEEVESVNPDLCFYDDEDKGGALRGVNYSHLITPMLKLLQEQQALITDLRARVAALEA
jgi:hypothetical protein